MTDSRDVDRRPDDGDESHIAEDLAAGQGIDRGPEGVPAEDVVRLASIREAEDQGTAVLDADEFERDPDEIERLDPDEMSHVRMYEGYLEAGMPPDEARAGETENPHEAAEEGLAWIPPTDPPVVPGEHGQPRVAAGFGTTADDEPFDADHHRANDLVGDERTERVREALLSHAQTANLVDRLVLDSDGGLVIVQGMVDDLDDEEAILSVVSEVEGVVDVVNRIEVTSIE